MASKFKDEKKWLGIKWNCCTQYSRIYIDTSGLFYIGNCPKCLKGIKIKVMPGDPKATSARFFEVD